MSISSKIGKVTGKLVSATVSAPKATGNKFKQIGKDLASGYHEVLPPKPEDDKPSRKERKAAAKAEAEAQAIATETLQEALAELVQTADVLQPSGIVIDTTESTPEVTPVA